MKLFYLTVLDEQDREKCGILGKIRGQINSIKKAGLDVHFGHFDGTSKFVIENQKRTIAIPASNGNTRRRMSSIYDNLFEYIKQEHINSIYIRFISLDASTLKFYRELKKINVRVIIEFYSHNLELEAKKTALRYAKNGKLMNAAKGFISLLINKHYYKKLHTCVDLIVTTTKVGDMYGVHTINVVNGIDISATRIRKREKNNYDFNIISVAMISPWHGYDRVIKGIAQYYKNGGKKNILYTVVGEGEEKANLEKMVRKLQLGDHVRFTGIKLKEEIDPYYNVADIALEMLAGFRRTKGQISSIKMAEYFAKGIPVLYAADKKIYTGEMSDYCYWVENSDSFIDIDDVMSFCERLYAQGYDIENKMHRIAETQFDWSYTMKELIAFLKSDD